MCKDVRENDLRIVPEIVDIPMAGDKWKQSGEWIMPVPGRQELADCLLNEAANI